jgi:hypothetical protein
MVNETLKQDRGADFDDFLSKLAERVASRAEERHLLAPSRVANVWRLNSAEATLTQDSPSSDLLITFRCGPDASRSSRYNAESVDATADTIIERLHFLTHVTS